MAKQEIDVTLKVVFGSDQLRTLVERAFQYKAGYERSNPEVGIGPSAPGLLMDLMEGIVPMTYKEAEAIVAELDLKRFMR